MMKTSTVLITLLLFVFAANAQSKNDLPNLALEKFADGFNAPMDITNCGDSRIFIVERLGKIWILDSLGNRMPEAFLNMKDKVFTVYPDAYDERGLLGLTFHPNYPDSPYLYVSYIGTDSDSHISRFTVDPANPNKAIKTSEYGILTVQQPKGDEFVNHKAGCLKFGADGYLYGTFGDGGSAGDPLNNSQNPRILLGKMFRIDVDHPDTKAGKNFSIPADNPYVNTANFRSEIWATGLRNPWRFSFDNKTGALWLPDVGQDKWEEINMLSKGTKGGKNFGWSCYEGNHNYKFDSCDYNGTPYTFPIVEYKHSTTNCASITGGFVYRGSKYPSMEGKYFYCDYCTGKFSTVLKDNDTWLNLFLLDETDYVFVAFGEDSKKELYVADNVNGIIYHLTDASADKAAPAVVSANDELIKSLRIKIYPNPNHGQFEVEVNAPSNETYKVYVKNIYGREVTNETRTTVKGYNRWAFTNGQLQKGIYTLLIQTTKGSVTQKFVIE